MEALCQALHNVLKEIAIWVLLEGCCPYQGIEGCVAVTSWPVGLLLIMGEVGACGYVVQRPQLVGVTVFWPLP